MFRQAAQVEFNPLDVCINKPFKDAVKRQHEAHMSENLQLFTEGKLTASTNLVYIFHEQLQSFVFLINLWYDKC